MAKTGSPMIEGRVAGQAVVRTAPLTHGAETIARSTPPGASHTTLPCDRD